MLIDADDHNALTLAYASGEKDIHKKEEFKRIQNILKSVKKSNQIESDIYTVITPPWIKGKMIFMTMATDKTYVGNGIDTNPNFLHVTKSGESTYSNFYSDSEGS